MPYPSELRLALLRCLRAPVCVTCGLRKEMKHCFCRTCYFALPGPMRNQLYARLSEAEGQFEDAYVKAIGHLRTLGMWIERTKLQPEARKILDETGIVEAMRGSNAQG